jgi:periplasmic protein TonB
MAERHTNKKWNIGMNSTRFQIGLIFSLSFAYLAFQTTSKMPKTKIEIEKDYFENFVTQIHEIHLEEPEPVQKKEEKKEETNPENFEKIELVDTKIDKIQFEPIQFSTPDFPMTPIAFFTQKPNEFKPDSVFDFSEVSPEFPGGPEALAKFLRKTIQFPDEAIKAEVDGRVIVEFMVGASGKVSRIKVLKDEAGYRCSESAMDAVEKMPNWTPGRVNDRPVNVWYRLPVYYTVK